jgi:type IV pilus assembly protein PilE
MPIRPSRASGFTLIELLIVLAIVAILAASAVAGYQFAVTTSRRAAAKGCLTEAAQAMERWYTTHMTYAGAAAPACSADVTTWYTIGFSGAPDARTYTLQAVPQGSQAGADARCGTLSLDEDGKRGASGSGGVAACW